MNNNLLYLYLICLITAMGGLMFGLDIAIFAASCAITAGGAKTFLFLALISFLQWLLTYLFVPETKGRSLDEIELLWNQ